MKAIQIHQFGGPETLRLEELPKPSIQAEEVLVKIYASGVNPIDWKAREGHMKRPLPFVPGWDFSGEIVETGASAGNFQVGDAVYSRPDTSRNGSYAEYIAVRVAELGHKPKSIDHIAAAAVPLAGLTAWQALFEHGDLQAGQKILIHGASGGVGTYAVQFAKWKGAVVTGTASKDNLDFVRQLGADEAIDYHTPGFEHHVRDLDMVFDTVGGDTQQRSLEMLRPGGVLVTTLKVENKDAFADKGVRITGMFAQSRTADLDAIAKLIDEGSIKIHVSRVFPLAQAADAQQLLENGHIRGKIVLKIA